MASARVFIEKKIFQKQAVLFSKKVCPESTKVKAMLKHTGILTPEIFDIVEIEKRTDCSEFHDYLWLLSDFNRRQVPMLFINSRCFGGYDFILHLYQEKRLKKELGKKLKLGKDEIDEDEKEEIVIRMEELDTTEIRVEFRELFTALTAAEEGEGEEGEIICPVARWAFDPWEEYDFYDEFSGIDIDVSAETLLTSDGSFTNRNSEHLLSHAFLSLLSIKFMDHESSELDVMRRSQVRSTRSKKSGVEETQPETLEDEEALLNASVDLTE